MVAGAFGGTQDRMRLKTRSGASVYLIPHPENRVGRQERAALKYEAVEGQCRVFQPVCGRMAGAVCSQPNAGGWSR